MKIKIEGKYKSLSTFESEELADFTVITGKNGSGKSQLIELIKLKQENKKSSDYNLEITPNFSRLQLEGIKRGKFNIIGNDTIKSSVKLYLENYRSLKTHTKEIIDNIIKKNISSEKLKNENFSHTLKKIGYTNIDEIVNKVYSEEFKGNIFRNKFIGNQKENINEIKLKDISNIFTFGRYNEILFYKEICNYTKKSFLDLKTEDFYNTPISSIYIDNLDMFNSSIETIFYCYIRNRELNYYNFFKKSKNNIKNNSISDSEYLRKHVAPWDLINEIFKENKINFKFNSIELSEFSRDISISSELIKLPTKDRIYFEDLSSGEKTIISLVLKLFASNFYQENLRLPELIILDEPDAHLHPEMSKLLIDVLVNTFVNKLGIKVIITTHSPSTVALAPEESIYQLKNEPSSSLKKISKDDALEILTEFIPTLSIDYKNHKQVFVESPTDINYYQTIFNKLKSEIKFTNNIYFISNGFGEGSCQQVINIVAALRAAGNKTSYGIIDWDNKNQTKNFTSVHGENKRYSIENYILDPIYIITLFLKLKAYNIHKELNLDTTYNEYNIGSETVVILQKYTDWVINKIYEKFSALKKDDKKRSTISYFNNKSISIPSWYLTMNGHKELIVKLKETFPLLKEKYANDIELENELIIIIGKCYPFIPNDTVELLKQI